MTRPDPATGAGPSAALLAGVAVVALAAVGFALYSQHGLGQQPCPWCVLQRAEYVAIALVCGIGALLRHRGGRRVAAALGTLLALAGAATALWQHYVAAASVSCNLTFADKVMSRWLQLDQLLPDVFEARASCADAAVDLLRVPYEFWSLALFTALALVLAWAVLRRRGP